MLTAVLIIPTGIGAAIGGYAGDAIPVVRALAQVCDRLITHPNVLNGAMLYWPLPNVWYVEGYALDEFAVGRWGLLPPRPNRIGLLLDAAIEAALQLRHRQAAAACSATLGLTITEPVITDEPLEVQLQTAASGATWGTVANPGSLLRAAEKLIQAAQADAIAIVTRFPDNPSTAALQHYRSGQGVDPLAGAEAVISHLVVQHFQIPAAHAPALQPLPLDETVHPRALAEEIGYTFLPSVLVGLSCAPRYSPSATEALWRQAVDAVIVPATALGGRGILAFAHQGVPILTVANNTTTLNVTGAHLGIETIPCQSYAEAIGVLSAMKAGVSWQSVTAAT
ncbi:DUF3326 domain-containing protein [Thermosynechococcus sp. HN-54]|uniref:DUF3326 domain-containing protein n=1 Tax=Thermosynechococcus sp. HN-54 TaxID=2933959 RepID=UPI00202D061D|nr:DUF3326 domain-containing protein [Thermosynechococcus sp. HN-54]URR35801.1 DUF3326 domain-containing protein [Thermosynechococcus sp. HN-54]